MTKIKKHYHIFFTFFGRGHILETDENMEALNNMINTADLTDTAGEVKTPPPLPALQTFVQQHWLSCKFSFNGGVYLGTRSLWEGW